MSLERVEIIRSFWPESPIARLFDVARKTARRDQADREWKEALCQAAETHTLREVAKYAGVSHARVAQIVGAKPKEEKCQHPET